MSDVQRPSSDLLDRISEVAGATATTELWCSAAQMLLYDCRDEIERLTRAKPMRRYVALEYCDEATDSGHSSATGLDSR